jgi:hypothetical protein
MPTDIFGIYDFDESGLLSVDETILAMRATIGGLCKIAMISYPLEIDIENLAVSVSKSVVVVVAIVVLKYGYVVILQLH